MKRLNIVVDVEADGPFPGHYSMVCFGAAVVESVPRTFFGKTSPISEFYRPDALAISGYTREEHEHFDSPKTVMFEFEAWLNSLGAERLVFWSDNNAFDFAFINYYCHVYLEHNPFGFSSRRIGDFYAGLERDIKRQNRWKDFRITRHTHNPVDDAVGNVEALLEICRKHNITI